MKGASVSKSEVTIWSQGPFSLLKRQLKIVGEKQATDAQIKSAARTILTFRDSGAWGIGDLCVYAEQIGKSDAVDNVSEELLRDRQMVRKCYYVARDVSPEQRTYDLAWSFYFACYTLPEDARAALLGLAEREKWTLDEFKKHLRDIRHTARTEQQEFPEGTYGLIYADPPWQYDNAGGNGAAENQYPTLSTEEIRDLSDPRGRGVSDLAAPDCILYMWATNAFLAEALGVAGAWGFDYKSNMVWVKDLQGTGFWARGRHELLLICTKGDVIPPHESLRPDSVIQEPVGAHSEKPAVVYEMLEALFPKLPKIELFARSGREGWDQWGNEAPREVTAGDVADANPDIDPETGDVPEAGAEQEARDAEAAAPAKKKRVRDRSKAGLAKKAAEKEARIKAGNPRLSKEKKKPATPASDAVH
jgi:N6-adenosine-specific RNA methylase IME4